ncbi:glyoxalase family protein [Bacillus freudenreichii]|nr:glyoxalase family protein [Bacillus freudenreichii]
MKVMPRAFSHVGLNVTDMDAAISWYERVFGFSLIAPPVTFKEDGSEMGEVLTDLLGEQIKEVKIAHLSAAGGVGLELFQFIEPKSKRYSAHDYWQGGFFHLSIIDPNIEGIVDRILTNGGKQRSKIWPAVPGTEYQMAYCEDPDGNLIEIYTHSVERMYSNLG